MARSTDRDPAPPFDGGSPILQYTSSSPPAAHQSLRYSLGVGDRLVNGRDTFTAYASNIRGSQRSLAAFARSCSRVAAGGAPCVTCCTSRTCPTGRPRRRQGYTVRGTTARAAPSSKSSSCRPQPDPATSSSRRRRTTCVLYATYDGEIDTLVTFHNTYLDLSQGQQFDASSPFPHQRAGPPAHGPGRSSTPAKRHPARCRSPWPPSRSTSSTSDRDTDGLPVR